MKQLGQNVTLSNVKHSKGIKTIEGKVVDFKYYDWLSANPALSVYVVEVQELDKTKLVHIAASLLDFGVYR